jgi:hypothetical protein
MPILYNVGNKLTAGSEPPQLYRYQDRVLGDGGTLETRDEASTFIRRLRSAGVLGSTVLAGVAGGVKAGTLYSIIGPDLDVTRGTVKNRVNRAGVLNQVASGVPATDFAGGVLRGTTVEPSAVNLALRSEDFTDAGWTKSSAGVGVVPVVTANNALAPNGEMTADRIDFDCGDASSNSNRSLLFRTITIASGVVHAQSIYIKAATPSDIGKTVRIFGDNFSTPVIITLSENYQRITPATITSLSTSGNFGIETRGTQTGQTASVHLWGAQLETGSVATSYIKTEGSAQTRNADVITKTGLGSVLPQTEGWVYAEVDFRALSSSRQILMLSDNSDVNRFSISVNPSNLYLCNFRFNSTSNDTTGGIPPTGKNKMLIYFSFGSVGKLFLNGLLVNTNSIGTPTNAITKLNLGSFYLDTAGFFNDPIHSYAIGSGAITDASSHTTHNLITPCTSTNYPHPTNRPCWTSSNP